MLLDVVDFDVWGVSQQRFQLFPLLDLVEDQLEFVDLEDVVGDKGSGDGKEVGFSWRREDWIHCDSE